MRLFIAFLCLLANALFLSAQNYLQVLDPQRNWDRRDGTIEEAAIVMKPQGIYTLVDLYLTFSARDQGFSNGTNLEVLLHFQLPEDAHVIDSWLWIDDFIVKAEMKDRWTASQIYEEIVGRNQDPSILFKNGNGNYELRIFPMASESTRRVKISYLMPARWSPEKVSTTLPLSLLQSSRYPVGNINLRVWQSTAWGTPRLEGGIEEAFQMVNSEALGSFWETNLSADQIASPVLNLLTDTPAKDGVFVGVLGDPSTSLYQMVLFPDQIVALSDKATKKLMLVLDYDPTNVSSVSQTYLLGNIKEQLKQSLSPQDSFNLIFSDLIVEPWSNKWLAGDDQTIDATFASLASNPIANYNNLAGLLGEGIQFIQQHGGNGSLLLAASNDNFGEVEVANALIEDLMGLMGEERIPIHILDYQNRNFANFWINNQYFRGNEYLYTNLSRLTGGYFVNQLDCCPAISLEESARMVFDAATALRGQMDIYTSLEEGFCYQRYTLGPQNEQTDLSQAFRQIGKYNGQFPFHIEMAGEYQGDFFGQLISIDAGQLLQSDTLIEEAWTGQYIKQLEEAGTDNASISTIINRSIEDRVLSLYTALIALEPSQGGEVCLDCVDESGESVVGTEDPLRRDSLLLLDAFPNPFSERVTIHLQLSEKLHPEDCQFEIFNLMGQKVFDYQLTSLTGNNEFNLTWEGKNTTGTSLAGGVYFFVVTTPFGKSFLRLNYIP